MALLFSANTCIFRKPERDLGTWGPAQKKETPTKGSFNVSGEGWSEFLGSFLEMGRVLLGPISGAILGEVFLEPFSISGGPGASKMGAKGSHFEVVW